MARDDLIAHRESAKEYVGFGIRLGDFKKLGWATPIPWFEQRLRELRRLSPTQKVWIFSDGTEEELRSLLADPLVSMAPERRDLLGTFILAKIAQMSGTKAMVVTGGSSFLRWGVFLGTVPTIAHAVDPWHGSIWKQISEFGIALCGDARPASDDWLRLLTEKIHAP